jgi:3-oxoacyl-[acyl-carrier protein] reductase
MNIIVNGGTRGIGKEVVTFLAQDIHNQIIVTGRSEKSLTDLSESFKNVRNYTLDMAVFESQGKKFINFVSSGFNKIDILINIAGAIINKDFLETSLTEGKLIMETNFFGPAALIGALKPLMATNSHIVNISSMGGFQGSVKYRGLSYYSASKSALACLTECLANEFTEYRISVNCLALGAVQTEMLNEAFPGYKAPVNSKDMAEFIAGFALKGHKFFNGKILPVAIGNP